MATNKGSQIKVEIEFSYSGDQSITLDTINYRLEFFCISRKIFTVNKADVEKVTSGSDVSYFCTVDTSVTGPGSLKMRMIANISDVDPRTEIETVDTGIIIE